MWIRLLVVCISLSPVASALNLHPVIAVLTQETNKKSAAIFGEGTSYLRNSYTRLPETAGALSLPVLVGQDDEYYEYIFNSTNGLIFPGGAVSLITSEYSKAARKLFNLAVQANDRGETYPIWGSCLGAQMLVSFAMDDYDDAFRYKPLRYFENKSLPINFTDDYKKSRLYSKVPDELLDYAREHNIGQHYHFQGVLTEFFKKDKRLGEYFLITSTAQTPDGIEIVQGMEGRKYPFFFFQYHPEKNLFEWDARVNVSHHPNAVALASKLGFEFVQLARQNNHAFPSREEEQKYLIFNYQTQRITFPFEMDMYFWKRYSNGSVLPFTLGSEEETGNPLQSITRFVTSSHCSGGVWAALVIFIVLTLVAIACCIYIYCLYRKARYTPIK